MQTGITKARQKRLPDVKLAMPWLQKKRLLQVFLDHVHLSLLIDKVQELSSL